MAALNFPSSPATNDVYTSGSSSWTFDGTSWNSTGGIVAAGGTINGAVTVTGLLTASSVAITSNLALQTVTFAGDTQLGNGGSAITVSFSSCNHVQIDLNSATCAITLGAASPGLYEIVLRQDASGSRLATWATTVHWLGRTTAPVLPTAGFSYYIIRLRFNGTIWFGEGLNVDAATA